VLTPFPTAKPDDFRRAIKAAEKENPDVLLMVQLGKNISTGIMQATVLGVKDRMQVVVPFLELTSTQGLPPKLLEEVIGTTDWAWQVPFRFRYRRGMSFVDTFKKTYNRYPSWGAVTAYTAVHEYADAVRRAGSFDTAAVIRALEGDEFVLLKNKQTWRSFDHQCVQSVYILRGKPASEAVHDESRRDVFEVLTSIPGSHCARSREDFELVRKNAGKSVSLEPLPE
jgi:ABC-type branched-subunit amino acid transport system substrate-binding protein